MVKIKQKKTMNLPQLIEYIEQTDYEACVYQADDAPVYVRVGRIKGIHIEGSGTVFPHNTFTVEVEEEVNGETILDRLYEVSFNGSAHDTNIYTNTTTNSLITSTTALIYTVIDNQVIVLWEKYTGGFR